MTSTVRRALAALLVLAPLAAAQDGAAPTPDEETLRARGRFARLVAQEEAALVAPLWDLADWCRDQRLYRERDRIARLVIELAPEHSPARRALHYHRRGDGWHQSDRYRVPRSHARDEVREEFAARLAALVDPFRARLFRALERDGRRLAAGTREEVLRRILILQPDDVALRTVLGERRVGSRWVLEETARALEEGTGVATLAVESLERAGRPVHDAPTDGEREVPFRWNATLRTPKVRVLGTTPRREVDRTARVGQAMGHLFHRVFRNGQDPRSGYTIYLLEGAEQREALLAGLQVDEPTREHLRRAAGGWLTPNRLGEWDANPARRLDGAARQTLGALLMDAYGIDGRHGWAWEGVGLYLVYRVVGTRMTYFFDRGAYGGGVRKTTIWPQLQAPDAQWLAQARHLLRREDAPRLEFLVGRTVDTMRDEDILVAYALAAYLLEGRPDDAPRILERIGAGEHPITVFEDVTGVAMGDLQARLARWLDEILAG